MRSICSFVLLLALAVPALAQTSGQTPSLTVEADAQVAAAPDLALVTLGVVSQAKNVSAAIDTNNANMTKVLAAIKTAGVADKDVATQDFTIRPLYSDVGRTGAQQQITGYQISNAVSVKIRDFEHAGNVIDQVVAAGANSVDGMELTFADPTILNDQATKAAIAEARRKAVLMADAAGVKLVRVLSVSTNGGGFAPVTLAKSMAPRAAGIPIAGGEKAVSAHATMTWEIAPQP